MLNPDQNLLLGKGKVFVDILDENGTSTGEVDLGNCTTFSLQPTVETTEKKSSMDADGGTLAVISRTTSVTLKIVGDYFNADNARLSGLCTEITETTPASTLADWVAQARSQAQALPLEAHLTRNNTTATAPAITPPVVTWDGSMVLHLPTRGTAP